MPKLKANTIMPTAQDDAAITAAALANPDARPFTEEEWAQVKPKVQRGRPLGSGTKTQVTLRLDIDTVQRLKATGAGWQTRANEVLTKWVKSHA